MHPFRSQIRSKTHFHHQRVDDLYSQLNLAERDDYTHFLTSHFIAFDALNDSHWSDLVLETFIAENRDLLRSDLVKLDVDMENIPKVTFGSNDCTMGVEYVLSGAHFGKQILVGRWSVSDDDITLSAGAYLQSNLGRDLWKRFTQHLDTISLRDHEKDVIFNSACSAFDLFSDSYHKAEFSIGRSQVQQAI